MTVRDHAMFALTIQIGLRISELAGFDYGDVTLGTGANVHTVGKGRRERRTPLVHTTRTILKAWLTERGCVPNDPLFPTTTGRRMSRDAIERRLTHHLALAAVKYPSIAAKHVTMHTLRHTAAMRLLLAGNDNTIIALWLGHEQIATTNIYLHADMSHKQQAIDKTKPLSINPGRYRPPDSLLAFLEALQLCRHDPPRHRAEQARRDRGRHNADIGIIVDPDPWQPAALHGAVEELADRFGVEEPVGGVAEHPVVGPARQPIASELAAPPSKLVQGGAVDLDASPTGAGLGCELDGPAADVLQGA